MSETSQKVPLGGLARKLIQIGLLNEETAFSITESSIAQRIPFVSALVEGHYIEPDALGTACAHEFGIPFLDLNTFDIQHIPNEIINQDLVLQYHALPIFQRGNRLYVAISDPTNLKAVDEIKYQTNTNTEAILIAEHKFNELIQKVLSASSEKSLGGLEDVDLESVDILNGDDTTKSSKTNLGTDAEDAPIVRFINKIILDAVNLGASDLHFEPYEKTYRIRFRRDGILYENSTPPVNISNRFSARLKVMARLDISERRVPQDGRFKMRISSNRTIDFRVSTCPTLFGEKIVMRVLDPSSAKLGIDALGYESAQKDLFIKAIHKPQGMVLVTGPTGSGKTISLYTALNILNTNEVNISTCEDPVEINLPGINQVNVNVKAGLTFSAALRAFLRQDPDVIMVGEIRDLETAEIAVKAAQTGHMVLSTLHTNSASDTLTRMINMGIPAYNLATSVTLVIAQRLARLLCKYCKIPAIIPKLALLQLGFSQDELSSLQLFEPKGCDKCKNGYKGRIGIYETLYVTPEISSIIMAGGNAIDLYTAAVKAGMWDLRKSGLNKVKQGLTSLEELARITKD
ncbi:MAG: type IV-A pilus assembly ATPase PilB [Gammaproteobacteria bacterium]|jgi:type IV pilus assembly protein PilB|nr:type IV-A pilus assembly ATPase PilB [Gammaproteobacteria bacterium]